MDTKIIKKYTKEGKKESQLTEIIDQEKSELDDGKRRFLEPCLHYKSGKAEDKQKEQQNLKNWKKKHWKALKKQKITKKTTQDEEDSMKGTFWRSPQRLNRYRISLSADGEVFSSEEVFPR